MQYRRKRWMTTLDVLRERSLVDPATGCWLWQGKVDAKGYGQVWHDGRSRRVHVVAFELQVGPVPEGKQLDHVRDRGCRHRHCWNVAHLEPVTNRENLQRSTKVGRSEGSRWQRRLTHCSQGHLFDGHNGRQRTCSTCRRKHQQRYDERKRAR
jgi:hypothetical protein